jgi:hypothetical protein
MAATQISLPPRIRERSAVPRLAIAVGAAGVALIGTVLALFAPRGNHPATAGGVARERPAVEALVGSSGAAIQPTPPATSVVEPQPAAPREPVVSAVETPPLPASSSAARPPRRSPPAPPLGARPAESRPPRSAAKPPAAPAPSTGNAPVPDESLGGRL